MPCRYFSRIEVVFLVDGCLSVMLQQFQRTEGMLIYMYNGMYICGIFGESDVSFLR